MSYNWNEQQYNDNWNQRGNYNMNAGDFMQEQQFQTFDYSQEVPQQQYVSEQPNYFIPNPSVMTPSPVEETKAGIGEEDEPPLLEELGIDPDAIILKTLNVLNPMRNTDAAILQDTDLAGPLVFCLAFGGFLLLSGKLHFAYIYGIGLLGCIGIHSLVNLMSQEAVRFGVIVSVLGYCLLPMVALSGANVILSLQGAVGTVLTSAAILWCSWSASKLIITAFSMDHQQPLIAYPCALFYAIFALITIF